MLVLAPELQSMHHTQTKNQTHHITSCVLCCVQTAFKRAAPTSLSDSGVTACPEATDSIDWDNVKPDDKTLVFQVSCQNLPTAMA